MVAGEGNQTMESCVVSAHHSIYSGSGAYHMVPIQFSIPHNNWMCQALSKYFNSSTCLLLATRCGARNFLTMSLKLPIWIFKHWRFGEQLLHLLLRGIYSNKSRIPPTCTWPTCHRTSRRMMWTNCWPSLAKWCPHESCVTPTAKAKVWALQGWSPGRNASRLSK